MCPERFGVRRAAGVALVATAVLCAATGPVAQKAADSKAMRVQLLHPALGLSVFIGGGANTMVFDRDDGVVVVDPKSAGSGPSILRNIESITDRRVTTGRADQRALISSWSFPRWASCTWAICFPRKPRR